MFEAILELLVLGKIPGMDIYIGYTATLGISVSVIMLISVYSTLRYRFFIARLLRTYSPDKLIEQISI